MDEPGLAHPRTALAWQRTALSLAGASVVLGRLAFPVLGAWAVALVAVPLALSLAVLATARRLRAAEEPVRPDATTAAMVAVAVAMLAATELTALFLRSAGR